uniref:Cyclin-A2 n=1 Tax=Nothobranchius furzeri TaxID=105023 RepID=A0A8C6NJ52_NOTFU
MSGANRQGNAASELPNHENMLSRLRGSLKHRAGENQENQPPKQAANRTVLGALQNNHRSKAQNQRGAKQETSQPLACKNEDFNKILVERPVKQPAFQIHVDEPDVACDKKHVAETNKAKPTVEESPLVVSHAVARLRQPLAVIEVPVPLAMDVSFDSPMDMSVIEGDQKPVAVNEVPEYAPEIHTYLRERETKTRPKAGYMKKQPDITNSMRAILVDWLVEVGEEYKLQNETLYLAINYIDRFLSSMSVLRGKLQLVGTAAMLLASKFEEIYPPEVSEFVYITDDTYTKKQVLKMEHLVLKVESLAMYLGELSLVDSDPFLKYLPSQTAAAAYVLANNTLTGGSWPKPLVEMTDYSLEDLMPCVEDLHRLYVGATQHAQQSVREKYKGSKYHEVSCISSPAKLQLN